MPEQAGYVLCASENHAALILNWRPRNFLWLRLTESVSLAQLRVKLFLGLGIIHSISKTSSNLSLAVFNPLSDLNMALKLVRSGNPWWAGVCLTCSVLPIVTFCIVFAAQSEFRANFKDIFGCCPTPFSLVALDMKVCAKNFCGRLSLQEEVYLKLRSLSELLGSIPWAVFQVYIAARQFLNPSLNLVGPLDVMVSLAFSVYSVYKGFDYFTVYAKFTTSGDKLGFLQLLMHFGDGLAPPSILERVRSLQHVVIEDDLSAVEVEGITSIFAAVESSQVLRTVHFKSTSLKVPPAGYWPHYCMAKLCRNRHLLTSAKFTPALPVPPANWVFELTTLEECTNGDDKVYDIEDHFPSTALKKASDGGALADIQAALTQGGVTHADCSWVTINNRWRQLALLLADDPERACLPGLLHDAASANAAVCVELLIFARADVSLTLPSSQPPNYTPLHSAAVTGSLDAVECLLREGAAVHSEASWGSTALDLTSLGNQPQVAKLLVKARANPALGMGLDRGGWTSLARCAQNNYSEVAAVLIGARADMEVEWDGWGGGVTPLNLAATVFHVETARVLVNARADPNHRNRKGATALGMALSKKALLSWRGRATVDILTKAGGVE